MYVVIKIIYLILIIRINCIIEINELNYRGISITWRRHLSLKFDRIHLEIIIILALSDKSFNLCDSHHSKQYQIGSNFGIECLDSWDNCLSWPFNTLLIECHSKSHEYPKSVIFSEINLPLPSENNSNNIFYKFQFPSYNNSCCWEDLNNPVRLISYLNLIEINKINSPPIARFPEHIYINLNKKLNYSLEIFDPDGDLFECLLLSSTFLININENCLLTLKSNIKINEYQIIIQIEIIEYLNNKKDKILSRLPYHIIGFIDHDNQTEICSNSPLINLLNIENNEIHILINEPIEIHLISLSQCQISMDECFINSQFNWKIKSHFEKTIENDQNQIEFIFEWIPKTIQQCGFHIHCIRCLDQLNNYIDKCINIFVNGPICQNVNRINKICSWSPFSIWSKYNQSIYKRTRICYETLNRNNLCSFCLGSSIQFQSSLAFLKDFELFEQSLLSPIRAHSTIKILLIASIIWIFILFISILISLFYGIKNFYFK